MVPFYPLPPSSLPPHPYRHHSLFQPRDNSERGETQTAIGVNRVTDSNRADKQTKEKTEVKNRKTNNLPNKANQREREGGIRERDRRLNHRQIQPQREILLPQSPLVNNLEVPPVEEVTGAGRVSQHHQSHFSDHLLLLSLRHRSEPLLQSQLPLPA